MNFTDWKNYLIDNKSHFSFIDWEQVSTELTAAEKENITSSIQKFQKGENSEGKNLIHYAKETGDAEYYETIKHFIREEQRHALILGKFMKINGIPKIKDHWVDSFFRKIRTLSGLENSITILITAEIIAAVYYKGLLKATESPSLRKICERILVDEEMHINFQSFTLRQIYSSKNKFQKLLYNSLHKILMLGTIIVVWFDHRNVLVSGDYSFSIFQKEVLSEFNRSKNMISGKMPIKLKLTKTEWTAKEIKQKEKSKKNEYIEKLASTQI